MGLKEFGNNTKIKCKKIHVKCSGIKCVMAGDGEMELRAWQLCVVPAKCIIEFTRLFHCGPAKKVSFCARLNVMWALNAPTTHRPTTGKALNVLT